MSWANVDSVASNFTIASLKVSLGAKSEDLLIPSVPIDMRLPPPLHIRIGIWNIIVKIASRFISFNFEIDSEELQKLKTELRALKSSKSINQEKSINDKKRAITKAYTSNPNKEVQKEFYEILKSYGIRFQKYHGGTLTGDHCHTFGTNAQDILEKTMKLLKQKTDDQNLDIAARNALHVRIETLISHVGILCCVFNRICHDMYITEKISDDSVDIFDKLCKLFGHLWRNCGLSVTPKLHIIERHLSDYMRKFGRIGILAEDIMERTWIQDHKWEEANAFILNWEKRELLSSARSVVGSNQDVMAVQTEAVKPQRQRKQSSSAEAAIPAPKSFDEIVEGLKEMQPAGTLFDIFSPLGSDRDIDEFDWFDSVNE